MARRPAPPSTPSPSARLSPRERQDQSRAAMEARLAHFRTAALAKVEKERVEAERIEARNPGRVQEVRRLRASAENFVAKVTAKKEARGQDARA